MNKLLILTLLSLSCYSQNEKMNNKEEMKLYGNVKSIKELSWNAEDKFGEILKTNKDSLVSNTFRVFSNKGDLIALYIHNTDGSSDIKISYEYHSRGNQIELIQYKQPGSILEFIDYKESLKY